MPPRKRVVAAQNCRMPDRVPVVDMRPASVIGESMRDCVLRLRGRPSLLVWCGSNEFCPPENLGVPMQNKILPELDGTRPWLPSSDFHPDWAEDPFRFWSGGPWNMIRLPEYFNIFATEERCKALNEIGLVSMPPMNSVARFLPDYNQPDPATPPFNRTMGYHDATEGNCGIRNTDKMIRKDLGEPACLSDYLSMGDLYNGLSYRAIFEAANKARPRNAGTHLWKVNAAWPSFWNENAILLLPGEERQLTVKFRTRDLHDKPPHLMVEGWNVLPAETDIATGKNVPLQLKVNHSEVVGEDGDVCVTFSGSQAGTTGERWTTWPVPVKVDDQVLRYVRLAVKSGSPLDAQVTVPGLPAGTHRIAVGDGSDHTITIP